MINTGTMAYLRTMAAAQHLQAGMTNLELRASVNQ